MAAIAATRRAAAEPNGPDAHRARKRRLQDIRLLHDDPGLPYIVRKDNVSRKYAKRYTDLTLRALALVEAVELTNAGFEDASLPNIQLDSSAKASILRSVMMLTDLALFRLLAEELVDDKAMREKIVDMYLERRLQAGGTPLSRRTRVRDDSIQADLLQELARLTAG